MAHGAPAFVWVVGYHRDVIARDDGGGVRFPACCNPARTSSVRKSAHGCGVAPTVRSPVLYLGPPTRSFPRRGPLPIEHLPRRFPTPLPRFGSGPAADASA